jgi:hypothetical protein
MVEYSIMAFKNLSFSIGTGSRELMVYFSFGGLILAVMGYWVKKWTGVIFSIDLSPPPLVEDPERFYRSGEK